MVRKGKVSTTPDNVRTLVRLLCERAGEGEAERRGSGWREERGGLGGGESSGRGGKCRAREGIGQGRISWPDVLYGGMLNGDSLAAID